MVLSWNRVQDWNSSKSLYLQVLQMYPESHMAANNLAAVYLEEDRVDEAIRYLN